MGERTVETYGSCTFEDLTNNRKAVLIMNTFKKSGWIRSSLSGSKDEIIGILYDSHKLSGDKESIKKNYSKDIEFTDDLNKLNDIKKKICDI